MQNREVVNYCNGLLEMQKQEKKYFDETGKKLFGGRIKIAYAISKNIMELRNALKAYDEVLDDIIEEYRDTRQEQNKIQEEVKLAQKENRDPVSQEIIMRKGKTKEEYFRKINELGLIETEVKICTVNCDMFDGLELDSIDIGKLIFMITE